MCDIEFAAVVYDYKPSECLEIFILGNDFLIPSNLDLSGNS